MQYIFVIDVYKINAILMRLMKSRTYGHMIEVFKDPYDDLRDCNLKPNLHILDNNCLRTIKKKRTSISILSSRTIIASKASSLLTVKAEEYYIITTISSIDPIFPLRLFDEFIPQI